MRNIYKWILMPSYLVFFLTFCNTNESNNRIDKADIQGLYKLDMTYDKGSPENTEVNWSAYKTNNKIKVSGSFTEFRSDRENQSFNSIDDLVDGLDFSISSLSSISGDGVRDLNLKDDFFKYLTDNFEINGTLGRPINDSIDVFFNVLGQNKTIRFGYSSFVIPTCPYDDQVIEIKGKINLINQFDAIKAYNSIHETCFDLHKGDDGISKTWEEVDVHIKALVINQNNPDFD